MPGVRRRGEQATRLPLEDLLPGAAFLPDLGGAGALDDQVQLLVEVSFGIQSAARWDLPEVQPRQTIGPVELEKATSAPQPPPWLQRQLPQIASPDRPEHRDTLLL